MTFKLGIVVGELSGDNLAADLVRALKVSYPKIVVEGILGPQLIKEGGVELYPMERLSVMGLIEPLTRLPELLYLRWKITEHFIKNPPDIFLGVDSPDFTLGIEKKLKKNGIVTIHYVSPSVWAWRRSRIKYIKKAVDLMLTLFPFEAKFYEENAVPVCFTGHPLADQIPVEAAGLKIAKQSLGLVVDKPVIALLPGSRHNEIRYLAKTFLQAAQFCYKKHPDLQFVSTLVSEEHKKHLLMLHQAVAPELPFTVTVGSSRPTMMAADTVLVTSGTATLEVMLHKKPMIVAYRMHPLTYQIARQLVKVPYIALPNLLAGECLVPEYIQDKAVPELLGEALLSSLSPSFDRNTLIKKFNVLHLALKRNASETAAHAIQILKKG